MQLWQAQRASCSHCSSAAPHHIAAVDCIPLYRTFLPCLRKLLRAVQVSAPARPARCVVAKAKNVDRRAALGVVAAGALSSSSHSTHEIRLGGVDAVLGGTAALKSRLWRVRGSVGWRLFRIPWATAVRLQHTYRTQYKFHDFPVGYGQVWCGLALALGRSFAQVTPGYTAHVETWLLGYAPQSWVST